MDALASAQSLYLNLARDMCDLLALEEGPEAVWSDKRSANRNLERYLCDVVLADEETSLVWGLDEVDRLFTLPFGSDVFGLFRSWHNRRALDPTGPWSRLTLAIAYATEAHRFITDSNQSPFNVGTRISLSDFSATNIEELNRRHGDPLTDSARLKSFVELVGGHPYLVRRGLAELVSRGIDIDTLCADATNEDGAFGDHLRRIRIVLLADETLRGEMRRIVNGELCRSLDAFFTLRSSGLVAGADISDAHPRCGLYAKYIKKHLG